MLTLIQHHLTDKALNLSGLIDVKSQAFSPGRETVQKNARDASI